MGAAIQALLQALRCICKKRTIFKGACVLRLENGTEGGVSVVIL